MQEGLCWGLILVTKKFQKFLMSHSFFVPNPLFVFLNAFLGHLEVKETIGDGSGRKYANSQFFNENRQV